MGELKDWEIAQYRGGNLMGQYFVNFKGTLNKKKLVLKEFFIWNDGETHKRKRTFGKLEEYNLVGSALYVEWISKRFILW